MSFFSTLFGICGFGMGISVGLVIGYFLFIYVQSSDVQHPVIFPLAELETEVLQRMFPQIPIWIKNPDFDRLDWLNKFLQYMWPYLDKAIVKTTKDIVTPMIAEQIKPYNFIESVEFEQFTLGTLPPTFQGMKSFVTDEKELIMEPCLKFAGNPNIIVAVKACGLKATVQVVDLQVFLMPRVTLKPLVPAFPCFCNIFVSLMEKPYVDFGLKLLGIDLMAIPGLYRFVQETISNQVADMYLWPKVLEVQVLDPVKALKRPVGIITAKVLKAMKLRKSDLLGSSDPYVKLKLSEEKMIAKKTTVKHQNLNPEWNEEFNMLVKDKENQVLKLTVFDWDKVGKHEKMGLNVVPLKDVPPDHPKPFTLDLLKSMDPEDANPTKSRGQLVVELTYKPFKEEDILSGEEPTVLQKAPQGTPPGGGLLVVTVHEAQDVEGKYHTNPQARILFKGEQKRTKHIKKTRDPRWAEEFQFMADEPPTKEKLHVEVVSTSSRNLRCRKEYLGHAEISLADLVANKRINEKYHLIDSKNGRIQIEMQWISS